MMRAVSILEHVTIVIASLQEPRCRFVDDVLPTRFVPVFLACEASAEGAGDGISTPNMDLPSEMITRISISSLPRLFSHPRLECYPPSWQIHKNDSLNMLGNYICNLFSF